MITIIKKITLTELTRQLADCKKAKWASGITLTVAIAKRTMTLKKLFRKNNQFLINIVHRNNAFFVPTNDLT